MTKTFKLKPPTMPHFVFYEIPPHQRQEGFNTANNSLSVAEFTPEEAAEYGEFMKREFIKHWEEKRKNKNNATTI